MIRLSGMPRISALVFAYSAALWAQQGLPDPVFDRVPFEEWLKGSGDAHIRWSAEILPARLGAHQRLAVTLSVRVDGAEFVRRNAPDQIVVFMEVRDRDDRVFRTHSALHIDEIKNPSSLASVSVDQHAFVVPGDYQVAAAVYDAKSKEHALKRIKLHVPPLPRDPLPGSWRDLPEVEFVTSTDPPDSWYLPDISSRLYLPVQNQRPVRVEVLVNESPTEATRRPGPNRSRNMGSLIPALKALSQVEIKNGSMDVTLLDLERRKVSFSQEEARQLDWTRLRAALADNDPNQIDVHALENHEQNAQFFVSEVRKRLESTEQNGDVPLGLTAEPMRVLIVLSGPMAFPKGQDLRPIEATPEPGSKVFYIRYYPTHGGLGFGSSPEFAQPGLSGRRSLSQIRPPPTGAGRGAPIEDSLAKTLKPLSPRVFDVMTPMDFRTALAAIINDISQLK